MKPQEIRIGNFVSFFNNDILKVTNYSFLVENVHHLQNLFFEIAKQELKLKKENGL